MIFILATQSEKTVNDVIRFLRLDSVEFIRKDIIAFNDYSLLLNLHKFDALFSRKSIFKIDFLLQIDNLTVVNYLVEELKTLFESSILELETRKKNIGNYFLQERNKINHINIARNAGLDTPKTVIVTEKKELIKFKNVQGRIINKSIKNSFQIVNESISYYNHTECVTDEIIENIEDTFFPSLFQEELNKSFELRIVFVNTCLWTMAIFSQNDEKTKVDLRNYNLDKPNRKVPFILPDRIKRKVIKFIGLSGLNIGAIDMVVTRDNRYVFLECNPNGQINMVSENCNYPIEKYIAEQLSKL